MLLKIIPWTPLLFTFIWAVIYTSKSSSNFEVSNHRYLESIPNLFTTVGVLGTFIGISIGLWNFDTENIDGSITNLLVGLRAAFFTSIVGIILSIIFSKWIDAISFNKTEQVIAETDPLILLSKNITDLKNSIHREQANVYMCQVPGPTVPSPPGTWLPSWGPWPWNSLRNGLFLCEILVECHT